MTDSIAIMSLPQSVAEVTPEWLSHALQARFPGACVTAMSIAGALVGTASKLKLHLEYNDVGAAHGLPRTAYLKGGFHGRAQRDLAGRAYVQEGLFYRDLAPHLTVHLPASYFAVVDPATNQGIVLLEDLTQRGVTFGRATQPLSVAGTAAALDELAKLHACGWQAAYVSTLTAWPGVIRETMDHLLTPEYWAPMLDRELADVVPAALRDAQRVKAALFQMWRAFEGSHRCLIHGDAHLGNMYFESEIRPGFLDWQSPMAGPCFDDVTYCLIGSLSIEDRRAHERELLRQYLDQLGHYGVAPPSFDATWLAYRQQVMHGFMWVGTPSSMQPDDIVAANTERFCAALKDLETLQALAA